MAKAIGIRPQVYRDIAESAEYFGHNSATTAERFIDACDATFELLSTSPQIGEVVPTAQPKLQGMRIFRIRGFSHVALYLERASSIEILRVVHGSRDLNALIAQIS